MNSFRLKNIKSFKDSGEINIKPITILVGKNSSGKSSLLRFPAVLAQTANYPGKNPPLSFFGDYLDFGNFEDIVFGKDQKQSISFSIGYLIDICDSKLQRSHSKLVFKKEDIRKVTIEVSIEREDDSVIIGSVSLFADDLLINTLKWHKEDRKYELTVFAYYEKKELISLDQQIKIHFGENDVEFEKFFPDYETVARQTIMAQLKELHPSDSEEYQNLLFFAARGYLVTDTPIDSIDKQVVKKMRALWYSSELMNRIRAAFFSESKNQIAYIGPFRQNPARIYRYSETVKLHVGTKGENIGDILVWAFKKSKTVFSSISGWLNHYFGYELVVTSLGNNYYQLMLKDTSGIQSNIIDVGFGISQVLPIVSEICLMSLNNRKNATSSNRILLIEQPELHLHPAAQACLAELFAMCVLNNPNARLIIETHSEHLISKLQVLIADEDNHLNHDMVQFLYVDKNKNGEAVIREMEINENGKFKE